MITIFTPVYNRAYCINRLYDSLVAQTYKDFEWIIIDDGSTDNIADVVNRYIEEDWIKILFFSQKNGGKHRAINQGVKMASSRLFMIVDSDDWLIPDAVEWILNTAEPILEDKEFAGLSGIRITPEGYKIGGGKDFGQIDANALDIRYKYHIAGDLAEVFKTEILHHYQFPSIDDEKFCPEALVWNRIAKQYKFRYCHKGIYVCKYLPDGLTAKITELRHRSPVASAMYYSEFTKMPVPFKQKVKGAINFWRFYVDGSLLSIKPPTPLLNLIGYLPGKLMRLIDKCNGRF